MCGNYIAGHNKCNQNAFFQKLFSFMIILNNTLCYNIEHVETIHQEQIKIEIEIENKIIYLSHAN